MLKIFIEKTSKLNEKELLVLIALNGLYSNKHDRLNTSVNSIGYFVTGRFLMVTCKRDRTILQNIRAGIQSLAERKLITILDHNGDHYVISGEGLQVDTEKNIFTVVELWELQKIFSESNKPFNMFAFFVNLVGTINNQTKEWHMSQDDMAIQWGVSKRTINVYLEQLEKMNLIFVYRHRKRRTDGTYHNINNSYGRYEDKNKVIEEATRYSEAINYKYLSEKIDRRGIKLRYNAFCGDAKKYRDHPEAIFDLYRECLLYNKSIKIKPIEGTYDGEWKQGEPLDLKVFSENVIQDESIWGEPDLIEPEIIDYSKVEEL